MNLLKLPQLQKASKCDVYIQQFDDKIVFYPVLPAIAAELTITVKAIENNKLLLQKEQLFVNLKDTIGIAVGVTYQGFTHRIVRALLLSNRTFHLEDNRIARAAIGSFPQPRLDLMHGFRFSQEALLTEALLKDSSGLIGAPTRYGKTTLMVNTLRAYPTLTTCVVAPGVDLVKQLYADITGTRGIAGRDVQLVATGRKVRPMTPGSVTVCSIDSVHRLDPGSVELLLADEPHALVASSRLPLIDSFPKARRIGYGATLKGRFDNKDPLIEGVFGPVLSERTYKEAVEEGAICPLHILFLKVEVTPYIVRDRRHAYNRVLFHNKAAANMVKSICEDVIPSDFQTMIFVKDERQADNIMEALGEVGTLAMAKRLTSKQREECDALMKANVIKRCICTKIYVQGVTFSDVRVLINVEAGGNNTSAIQKPGRLAEIRPGKKCGIVIDFLFVPPGDCWEGYDPKLNAWMCLCKDSNARRTAYEEKGYSITVVNNIEQLKEKFDELI